MSRDCDLEDILKLLIFDFIHELIPVSSQGILLEVNVIAKDTSLCEKIDLHEMEQKSPQIQELQLY